MAGRRATLTLSSALALLVLALPLSAGAERSATRNIAVVKAAFNKKLKKRILVTDQGMTLYLWASDPRNTPTCEDDSTFHCSTVWVPYRSTEPPVAGSRGVRTALLKTVNRTDGDPQVMYNGHPLYTDAGNYEHFGIKPDLKPGDINGQDKFGWYVVSPLGKAITKHIK
jgi:predicted lipoprotein with Yx(FWY)xxD motif